MDVGRQSTQTALISSFSGPGIRLEQGEKSEKNPVENEQKNTYTMKERIRQVMQIYGLTQNEFAARLGMSPGSVSSIFTGRTNPTNNHVRAIHRAFPAINVNWLLFGEGEVYSKENAPLTDEPIIGSDGSRIRDVVGEPQRETGKEPEENSVAAGPLFAHPSAAHEPSKDDYSARYMVVPPAPPARCIKEIRVFYDDGTYESFAPFSH